jgi:hypothetical protein
MTDIQKYDNLHPSLFSNEKKAIEAIRSPKFSEMDISEIKELFVKIMLLIGIPERNMPNKIEFDLLCNTSKNVLKYTKSELLLATEMALSSEISFNFNLYDKIFSITLLSDLMKSYHNFRQESIYKNDRLLNSNTMELSKEEIYQKNLEAGKNAFIRIFNDFKETGIFKRREVGYYETMSCIYDFLDAREIISIPNDRKKLEFEKAKKIFKTKLEDERLELTNRENICKLNEQLKNWNKTIVDEKESIKNVAKTIIVEDYICSSIEMEMDLGDIL